MKNKSSSPVSILIATSALIISCSAVRASETDDRIESSAKNSYVFRTFLKDDSVTTESKDGAVILTGTDSQASHKSLAQDTVEGLPSVKSVDNQLTVKSEGPSEKVDDASITAQIKGSLLTHRSTSAMKTQIETMDGVVTASGIANNANEKTLVTKLITDINGVISVTNNMSIRD